MNDAYDKAFEAGKYDGRSPVTPKEQYEARKAERQKLKDMSLELQHRTEQVLILDMLDRFVTAVEAIALAMPAVDRQAVENTKDGQ